MKNLLKDWNTMRIMRLLAGAVSTVVGVIENNGILLFLGIFLMIQALLNAGCCCGSSCGSGNSKKGALEKYVETYKAPKNK